MRLKPKGHLPLKKRNPARHATGRVRVLVRSLVEENGFTLSDLAGYLGLSYHTLYAWRVGRRRKYEDPSWQMMNKLLKMKEMTDGNVDTDS